MYRGSCLTSVREQKGRVWIARNSMQKHWFVQGGRRKGSGGRGSRPAQLPGEKTALLLTQDSLCLTMLPHSCSLSLSPPSPCLTHAHTLKRTLHFFLNTIPSHVHMPFLCQPTLVSSDLLFIYSPVDPPLLFSNPQFLSVCLWLFLLLPFFSTAH